MQFEKVVLRRRTVRHFRHDPVPTEVVNKLLSLAQHAPSAGFNQGSAYIVLTNPDLRKKVGIIQGEQDAGKAGFHKWVSEAPVSIVACVSEKIYHDRYREPDKLREDGTEIEWPTPYWFFDVGCGCMIILLAAVDSGLAAGFSSVFDIEGMRELLGIPEHFHPVGVISIGYADKDIKSPSLKRGRKSFHQVLHYEHW